jgi:hypothetical protein
MCVVPAVKAFRGLRYVPARVELAAVLASDSRDPRRVHTLLDDEPQSDDGADGALRRAKLRLAEWRRAGIVRADDAPCLYALRRRDGDGNEFVGVFCALGVDNGVDATPDAQREARLDKLGVAVEPVVAAFSEPRVKRALENAIDRDPDATWKMGDDSYELWSVDDESTTARIGTLLSQATLTVEQNGEAWGAHAAWWKKRAQKEARDDDRARAGAFALAFLHPADEAWPVVPAGVAMAPLAGALE